MLKEILREIIKNKKRVNAPNFIIKNFLKEYLQYPVLDFLYNSMQYRNLIFTGGSCLHICYNAPRLSEDLDFDLEKKKYGQLNLSKLAKDLACFFQNKHLLTIKIKCQEKMRIYLKFPLLKELDLALTHESDLLYVKLEFSAALIKRPKVELTPISHYGYNFLIRNYPLPVLMANKINALLSRKWFKGKKDEVDIKGRDFYDLYWYLQKGVWPNLANINKALKIKNFAQLKKTLLDKIEKKVTAQKLNYDLKNFFPDQNFVDDFCKNYKIIIKPYLQ